MIQAANAAPLGRIRGRLWCGMAVAAVAGLASPMAAGAEPAGPVPSYYYHAYTVETGLPHNSAGELLQTRDGYLWIGTDSGLARFDGNRFTNYRVATAPGLADNLIRCLYEDRAGTLWIGTQRGLSRMRQGQIELVEMPRVPVTSLTQDRAGRIWIATLSQGLWVYRDGQAAAFSDPLLPPAAADSEVRGLFTDSTGWVWMWVRTKGVTYLENDRLHLYEGGLTDRIGLAYMFVESPRGTLWLGTNKGLLRLRGREVTKFGPAQGLTEDLIRALYADPHGQVWVATNRLYRLADPASDVFVPVPLPAFDYNFRAILQDREGSYWVGSAGYGIARMQPSYFRTITAEGRLSNGIVRTVAGDSAGAIWAGLSTRGAVRIAPDGKTTVVDLGTDARAEVWAVLPAADGSVWFGTRGSLWVWRSGALEEFPRFQRVRALFQDRTGAIWIGADLGGGVVRYQNGAFTSLDGTIPTPATAGGAPVQHPVAYVFAEDAEGAIYAGLFRRGVIRLKDGVVTRYEMDTGFPTNDIRAIYPESDGTLWVGTRGSGLIVFDHGRWLHPDALSEPFNDQVATILADRYGHLWLGTPKGIVWAPKAELLAVARGERPNATIRLAGSSEGVQPGMVGGSSTPGAWQTPDGALWFATLYGLVKVDPETLPFNSVVPPVRIEHILVNDQPAAHVDAIELPAGTRSLAIEYTAMSYVRPAEVRFRYRLGGHDAEWVNVGARRTAYYTNLPPGHYRFQVIASNDDDVWNTTGAGVDIVQLPFFYQTMWFWSTVAVGLGLGVLGFYRVRTANLRRRNERLELRIAERTAALAERSAALAERSTQLAKSYEDLKQTQQELLETSRLAGIAEMATGVLHNLGNALNSVNTTVSLSADRVQRSKIAALGKVVLLLEEQHGRLAEFFSTDPRGRQLPAYLAQLSSYLATEQADLLHELEALQQNVDHIKEIVAAQQSYAHVSGLTEIVPASELVEYSLRLNEAALQRHGIEVVREFRPAPPVKVERQKVLQILVNLIRNAREAINDGGRPDKRLVVGVQVSAEGRVQFTVTDNGVGIAPENLTRVFSFGFTTKVNGHGFGLHTSANAAKEMGGSLAARSDGPGEGATLILELPPAG
jgi:ligand-binding sensor domain-containing protein/signal transduction histidine kinase